MKLSKKIILAGAATLLAGTVSAQTLTAFESGTTASASEVNANFTALLNAINALDTRLDALEAEPAALTLEDLVGRTYCVTFIGTISGQQTNFARFSSFVGNAKLAITSTSQGTLTVSLDREHELGMNVGGSNVELQALLTEFNHVGQAETVVINSLSNGVLSTAMGDFNFASDGSAFTGVDHTFASDEGENSFIVGIRCD